MIIDDSRWSNGGRLGQLLLAPKGALVSLCNTKHDPLR